MPMYSMGVVMPGTSPFSSRSVDSSNRGSFYKTDQVNVTHNTYQQWRTTYAIGHHTSHILQHPHAKLCSLQSWKLACRFQSESPRRSPSCCAQKAVPSTSFPYSTVRSVAILRCLQYSNCTSTQCLTHATMQCLAYATRWEVKPTRCVQIVGGTSTMRAGKEPAVPSCFLWNSSANLVYCWKVYILGQDRKKIGF